MTTRSTEGRRATPVTIVVAAVLGAAAVGLLFGSSAGSAHKIGIAAIAGVIVLTITIRHPNFIYFAFAFILGGAPFAIIPGVGQPAVVVLALLVWLAVLTHPIAETRTSILEFSVAILVIISFVSMAMTMDGMKHVIEFGKWFIATSLVFALLRLNREVLRSFGKWYVAGAFLGAAFAMAVFFLDKAGTTLNYLSVFGYGRTGTIGTHLRFYVMENSTIVRLTGTYVDPNAAGIFLLVGFALSVALLRGWARLITAPVILGALIITLSRSAILSVAVAILLFLLFQRTSTGRRLAIVWVSVVGAACALSVPAIYSRVFDSFGSSDTGATDRARALGNFTTAMTGNWWWGRGWGVPEFTDEVVGWKTNYVANSPLLTVYRGGVLTGIAFVVMLIAGAIVAYRYARKSPWESGVIGAMFVGFSLVGLQLDFPVVTSGQMTMAFSVFLAFLAANPIEPEQPDPVAEPQTQDAEVAAPRGRRVTSDV